MIVDRWQMMVYIGTKFRVMRNYQKLDAWKKAIEEHKFNELTPLLDETIKLINGLINFMEKSSLK